jgi:PAS domain S-box-containing protein
MSQANQGRDRFSGSPIRVLVIEDNPGDARLLQEVLREAEGAAFQMIHQENLSTGMAYLVVNEVEVILLDLGLPDSQGLATYLLLHEKHAHVPIIVLSGLSDNALAAEAVRLGAQDYLVKAQVNGDTLHRSIRYAMERKQVEEDLRRTNVFLDSIIENIPDMIFLKEARDLRFVRFNRAGEQLLGYPREALIGKNVYDLFPQEQADFFSEKDREVLRSRTIVDIEEETLRTRHQGVRTLHTRKVPLLNESGEPEYLLGISEDVTTSKLAIRSMRSSEERYRALFENMKNGFSYCEMLWDGQGRPVDFRYLEVNKAFGELTGLHDVVGKVVTELIPGIRQSNPEVLEIYGRVAHTGLPEHVELYLKPLGLWFSISIYSTKRGFFSAVFENITDRKRMEKERQDIIARLRKSLAATVQAITKVVETRDPYTAGHQRRVADLARAMAGEMGFSADRMDFLRIASTIHDIGKVSIPAEILSKPTKLNVNEYSLIKLHAQAGYDILKDIEFPWPVADVILQHHERMNGSGYPMGRKGEEILPEARILAVADVVESMSSHRPYRPASGVEAALTEIQSHRGILYDGDVVDACLRLFRKKDYAFKP